MSKSKKRQFEKEIENNNQLKEELAFQQDLDKALLHEIKVQAFKDNLNTIHETQINSKTSKTLNIKNKWYWAAASITILSGTALYSIKQHLQNTDSLYNSYYEPWQPNYITRGSTSENIALQSITQFENGNYNKVIELLNESFMNNTIDPKMILIKGCAEMELNEFNSAIKTFMYFDSQNYSLYTEAGKWYLALCYLKIKEIEKSKIILTQAVANNTSYANEAKKLLKKLN